MTCSPRQYFLPTLRTLILKAKSDDSLNPEATDFPDPAAEPITPAEPIDPLPEDDIDPDAEDRPKPRPEGE